MISPKRSGNVRPEGKAWWLAGERASELRWKEGLEVRWLIVNGWRNELLISVVVSVCGFFLARTLILGSGVLCGGQIRNRGAFTCFGCEC